MSTPNNQKLTIRDRLHKLPYYIVIQINRRVSSEGVALKTYHRVLGGDSQNLKTLSLLSDLLSCTLDEIMNPEFSFDPERVFQNEITKKETELTEKFNLHKAL